MANLKTQNDVKHESVDMKHGQERSFPTTKPGSLLSSGRRRKILTSLVAGASALAGMGQVGNAQASPLEARVRPHLTNQFGGAVASTLSSTRPVTVNGHTYNAELLTRVYVDSGSRNYNFRINAAKGTKLLFEIEGDTPESVKNRWKCRLKRDKKNATDKNIRNPLYHGDTWNAECDYTKCGKRFYIQTECGQSFYVNIYAVK